MKIKKKFLIVLLSAIIISCKSNSVVDSYELPPKPQRKEITIPKDEIEYIELLQYYELLVEKWEMWGEAVEKIVIQE